MVRCILQLILNSSSKSFEDAGASLSVSIDVELLFSSLVERINLVAEQFLAVLNHLGGETLLLVCKLEKEFLAELGQLSLNCCAFQLIFIGFKSCFFVTGSHF